MRVGRDNQTAEFQKTMGLAQAAFGARKNAF